MKKILALLLISLLILAGCTTDPLRAVKVSPVTIKQAADSPESYRGSLVRWGGTILGAKNRKDYTQIEVLGKPLVSGSEPDDRRDSTGRFMVRIPGFVDPAEYHEPNRITVVGSLQGVVKQKVGSYLYTYPVVEVQQRRFWKGSYRVPEPYYYSPWWYDYHHYHHWPYWYPYHRPPLIKPQLPPPVSPPPVPLPPSFPPLQAPP